MEIYNDLYTQRVAYYQHFGQLILNCVFLIQVKFPKINWKYFNSTPVVRSLPRIGVVASMSILYVVLSQYVPTLFAFAYHCPISDQFRGQQQKHLINVLVLVLILETQPQQGKKEFGLYSLWKYQQISAGQCPSLSNII